MVINKNRIISSGTGKESLREFYHTWINQDKGGRYQPDA
jgi:hypothetical protein